MARAADVAVRVFFCGALALCGAIVFWPVHDDKVGATKTMCLSRMKNLSVAALIYADNHDELLPSKPWIEAIRFYDKNLSFNCGRLEKDEDLKWGFAMEESAVGRAITTFKDPTKQPLFIESDILAPNLVANLKARSRTRHGRGSNIAFANGMVKFRNYDPNLPDTGMIPK